MKRNFLTEAVHFLRSYFSPYPSYLILFITAVCNARCKHCFYWKEIASADARKELKLPELEKIASSLDLIYLSIGGGEPFLRADLVEVVKAFYERSGLLYCNIVSNGFSTDRTARTVEEILATCPRLRLKVQLSFDDFEEAHDENRGVSGIYSRALETLRVLSKIRDKHRRFTLDVATCMTATNKSRVGELGESLRAEVVFDSYQLLYPRGDAEVPQEMEVGVEEWWEAVKAAKGDERKQHNPILATVSRIARNGIYRFLKSDEHPWDCLAGEKFVNITERGVLQPCEILSQMDPELDSDLGQLSEFDFDVKKALDSLKARRVVSHIKETKCRCSFECAANCNVVFSKKEALGVVKAVVTGD